MPLTTRPVQQQKSNSIIRLCNMFCYTCERLSILGKFNPSEIFRGHSADLCDAIESIDVSRLANRLFSMFLIDNECRIKITGLDSTSYKKAEMIVNELQRRLESAENNSDPVECLNKICEALLKMKDDSMTSIVDDIKSKLEMYEDTEESKTTTTILIGYTVHTQDRTALEDGYTIIHPYINSSHITHCYRDYSL